MTRRLTILATRQEIELCTTASFPPIPLHQFDWSAIDLSTYDGTTPHFYGETELAAINALLDELEAQ